MKAVEQAGTAIREAFAEFGTGAAVLTSFQREGVVITDLALRIEPQCRILTIDTGRLPESTIRMITMVESHFGTKIQRIQPDASEVDSMVELYGKDLFRDSAAKRMLCCEVRKVRSLERALKAGPDNGTVEALFVGLRREQSDLRKEIAVWDRSQTPVKISPLAGWTSEDVIAYTREYRLPEHPLYAHGYRSIGCDPCTRAVRSNDEERSGRWWWESDADKECGLHFTPDGRAVKLVDVLLREIMEKSLSNEVGA